MSLNKSARLLQQCRFLASAAVRRRGGSSSGWPQQRVLQPLQLHNDSSQSKRTVSATTDQHYTSFAYRSHPSAPVTVGWVNLEQQQWQHHSLQQRQSQQQPSSSRRGTQRPAAKAAVSVRDNDDDNNNNNNDGLFYGLPLRVDEPPPSVAAASEAAAVAATLAAPATTKAPTAPIAEDGEATPLEELEAMNRNARRPKRANGGKRPVSRVARRQKKRSIGNHRR